MEKGNIFGDFADPGEWWFYVLLPLTLPLLLLGELIDLIF